MRENVNAINIPSSEEEALNWLIPLLDQESSFLHNLPKEEFLKGWNSIFFLYAGLHPDGALERGEIAYDAKEYPPISSIEPKLVNPYYMESGWPVILVPMAEEVFRRKELGDITEDDVYCCEAQLAGMGFRKSKMMNIG